MEIKLKEIGKVKNSVNRRMDADWGEVTSQIQLDSDYRGAFKGLKNFSHAIIITYLHQATYDKNKHLQRHPRNIKELPLLGILSQRGKNRPNPIGITAVEIVNCSENILTVTGLDAINDTPVLDVKPYFPQYDCKKDAKVPNWVDSLMTGYF